MAADMEITTLMSSEAPITASVVDSTLSFRGQAFADSQVIEADLVAEAIMVLSTSSTSIFCPIP
jgi:hypothetical protein